MITTLILIALKSMLVAAVTLGLLRLAARRSAAERSTVAHLGLCALLVLPLANFFLPSLPVLMPEQVAFKALQAPISVIANPILVQPTIVPLSGPPGGVDLAHRLNTFVLYVYPLPAIALLLFICAALLLLVRLRAHARPVVDPVWLAALARAQSRMDFTKNITLLSSGDIFSPIGWGLIRPIILLNEEILAANAQAEAIIAHELAHMIQHDWAKLILARIVTAAYWFNPLAWLLAREAHQLREEAADDAVLAADIAGPDYAALLIGVARCESRGFLSVVHGVAPSRTSLRRRVTRVLDDGSARAFPCGHRLAALTAAMLIMTAPLAVTTFKPATGLPHGAKKAIIAALASITPVNSHDASAPPPTSGNGSAADAPNAATNAITVASAHFTAARKHRPGASVSPRSAASRIAPPLPWPSLDASDTASLQPQVSLDQLPQMLRANLDAECAGHGGTPGPSPNLFTSADLNGDGISDLVFDRKNYKCRGAASPMGSSRYGTTLTIFVGGDAGSLAEVYTGSFYRSRVEEDHNGKPFLTVAATADCGEYETCERRVVLDTATHGFVLGSVKK
jgi:beta-lactamase regulating signal transducer with metallopeptidase domain